MHIKRWLDQVKIKSSKITREFFKGGIFFGEKWKEEVKWMFFLLPLNTKLWNLPLDIRFWILPFTFKHWIFSFGHENMELVIGHQVRLLFHLFPLTFKLGSLLASLLNLKHLQMLSLYDNKLSNLPKFAINGNVVVKMCELIHV